MAGSNMAAEGSSGYMSKGADQKNAMEMNSGDMMSGDKSAKHMKNGDKKAGSGAASADSAITVLTSCKGGNAPVEQIAQPSMDKGTMHKVSINNILLQVWSTHIDPAGHCWRRRGPRLQPKHPHRHAWRHGRIYIHVHEPHPHPINLP